jgi:alkylation response protein AidB-like acyl-CoA dehydrogenase
MHTRLTEDEEAVREVFDGFFANESPIEVVRAAEPGGHNAQLWSKLAATGAPGMAVPAAAGGGDASLRDLAVVVETWGAHIAPVPLVDHAVAARLLHAVGAPSDLLDAVVAGEDIATVALRDPADGTARLVPAGAIADIVLARTADGIVASRSAAPGSGPRNTGDLPLADRDVSDAVTIGDAAADNGEAWDRSLDEWRALMAVAHVGLARRAVQLGVEYAKERIQFDVPIGTFQAVKHGLADAATKLEGAHLLAHRAVWALDTDQPDASRLAGMALLFSGEMARFATDRSLQYHGGYGFSEEYDIQMYHRRASAWMLQLGEPGLEYARLADAEFGPRRQNGEAA